MVGDILTGPLIDHLADVLGVPVVGQTPGTRPDTWILVERTGGTATIASDTPMVSLDVWAPTKVDASALAHLAWDYLTRRMPPVIGGVRITRRIPVSGPTYQPAASSGGYRYRIAVQIRHQIIQEAP